MNEPLQSFTSYILHNRQPNWPVRPGTVKETVTDSSMVRASESFESTSSIFSEGASKKIDIERKKRCQMAWFPRETEPRRKNHSCLDIRAGQGSAIDLSQQVNQQPTISPRFIFKERSRPPKWLFSAVCYNSFRTLVEMINEASLSLPSTSIVLEDCSQTLRGKTHTPSQEPLLRIDYVDSQLIFLWDLSNIPVQQAVYVRHVFVFDT